MKKVLIIGLLLGAGWYAFAGKKDAPADSKDVFVKYNGRIVSDAKGYWMIIRNGKLYSVKGTSAQDWFDANPNNKEVLSVPENIWEIYSKEHFGGLL